jgi:hypothetical protein
MFGRNTSTRFRPLHFPSILRFLGDARIDHFSADLRAILTFLALLNGSQRLSVKPVLELGFARTVAIQAKELIPATN